MLRIVIAGSRSYCNFEEAETFIRESLKTISAHPPFIILCGGAKGADQLGEKFALCNAFPIEHHFPQWQRFGKAAGPIRNQKMAELCDVVICFWNGKSKETALSFIMQKSSKRRSSSRKYKATKKNILSAVLFYSLKYLDKIHSL